MPLIGNDLLSQFKIVINYPKDEMLMIPYHDFHFKKNRYSIGINTDISEKKEIIVKGVWENSPADDAKIEVGDIIISFNSQKATHTNVIELIKMNRGTTRKIKLNKRMLF